MRVRSTGRLRPLALGVVCALVLSACGDGRNDDEEATATTVADAGGGTDTTVEGGEEPAAFEIDTADCETDPASVTIEGDTIKLGTSLPQSGIYATFAEILRGEQAYIKYLNDELGGVEIAGKKYKIELVAKDDGYQSDQTVSNVDSLIRDDGVFALFDVVGTKNNLAIRDAVDVACIPNLFAATGSPAWGNPEHPWMLGTMLVPYPLEMKALVDYLTETKPDASIAVLRADDDFGLSYSDTLKSLIEGTDLTIAQEETYDPEGADVASQVTSLAATNADVFLVGATLLACPQAINEAAKTDWKPITYMSGTCTTKTLMAATGESGAGVLSVTSLMDPSDPQFAAEEAMVLYKEKIAAYGDGADATNGIVAYGWSVAALLQKALEGADAPNRLAVMQAARTVTGLEGVGLQLPGSTWSIGTDDRFLGENFYLVQYDLAGKFFGPVGELKKFDDETETVTPEALING